MNKIVCFYDCFDITYDKRVREFVDEGYDVEVYAFTYRDESVEGYTYYKIHHLGHYQELPSYLTRAWVFTTKIRKIIKSYDRHSTLFFFFTLNTAFSSLLFRDIKYLYEEDDMLFDRVSNILLRGIIEWTNKHIIKKSVCTFFASEGFADYYFKNKKPNNIYIFPNKVLPECLELPPISRKKVDFAHLKFGFVGGVRYESLYSFSYNLASMFPQYEFHFYGMIIDFTKDKVEKLVSLGNVYFHGKYKAPDAFPEIYSNIDFVVATYDTQEINPKYAEPNKLYESVFFEVPIIVSNDSFLADKVKRLGTGFDVNPYDIADIKGKIERINDTIYNEYLTSIRSIPKSEVINNNKKFFEKFKVIWNKL